MRNRTNGCIFYFNGVFIRKIHITMKAKKQLIHLTESDLHRIVKESVNRVLYNEGFGDRFRGAINGFQQGNHSMRQNDEDAQELNTWVRFAQNVLRTNDPNDYREFIERFVNAYGEHKNWQRGEYGQLKNYDSPLNYAS